MPKKINKVTLIGLGAMGSFFAPQLQKYLTNDGFRVLANGKRKERLESKGVVVNGISYHFNIVSSETKGDFADLIIIAVKDTGLSQAITDIQNQVGPETQILCVLNGIDSEEKVAAVYGWEHVIYSYMRVSIIMKDGVAEYDTNFGKVHFGEANNEQLSDRVLMVRELFENAKISYSIEPDMIKGMWFKFMCNIGENMTCALLGVPFGAFHISDHANEIRRNAMREVIKIANRLEVDLSEQDIEWQENTIMKLPFNNKPSTLQDLENKRATEIEMFAGKIVKLGQELGIDTPINWLFYNGIKVLEEKNEGKC